LNVLYEKNDCQKTYGSENYQIGKMGIDISLKTLYYLIKLLDVQQLLSKIIIPTIPKKSIPQNNIITSQ